LIFDTSVLLRVLREKDFLERLSVSEEVRITSITVYELLRGAVFINLTRRRDREMNIVLSLISELNVIPLTGDDAKVASYIWARLREKGESVSDADILVASICSGKGEKLLTLNGDYEKIRNVYEKLEVEILKEP